MTLADHPKRVQRQRMAGWRMPEGAVYVGRPSQWGNHWKIGDKWYDADTPFSWSNFPPIPDAETVVKAYRQDLGLLDDGELADFLSPLCGHDLVCWCPLDKPCHADVLLELVGDDPR